MSDPAEDDLYEKCAGPERKYAKDHEARTTPHPCLCFVSLPSRTCFLRDTASHDAAQLPVNGQQLWQTVASKSLHFLLNDVHRRMLQLAFVAGM